MINRQRLWSSSSKVTSHIRWSWSPWAESVWVKQTSSRLAERPLSLLSVPMRAMLRRLTKTASSSLIWLRSAEYKGYCNWDLSGVTSCVFALIRRCSIKKTLGAYEGREHSCLDTESPPSSSSTTNPLVFVKSSLLCCLVSFPVECSATTRLGFCSLLLYRY